MKLIFPETDTQALINPMLKIMSLIFSRSTGTPTPFELMSDSRKDLINNFSG